MPKVAPAGGGKAAGGKKSPRGGGKGHRPAPDLPETGAFSQRNAHQTQELQSLLRLRAEELIARDNDLAACGEQIVHLEAHNEALQRDRDEKERMVVRLTHELETLHAQQGELSEQHSNLRAENARLRSESAMQQKLIHSTPGIMPTPDVALAAIRRAQHADDHGSPGRSSQRPAAARSPEWKLREWLGTTRVLDLLTEYMLGPLTELMASEKPSDLSYLRSLINANGGYDAILELLSQHELQMLKDLASELHNAGRRLGERSPPRANEVCGKYVELLGDDGVLQPGASSSYETRLEHLLGPPHNRVLETMLVEHCEGADAAVHFVAATYKMTTTSRIEWWFVVDPVQGASKHVNVQAEMGGAHVRLAPSGYPAEAGLMPADRARAARPLAAVLQDMKNLNIGGRLKAVGMEALVDAEIIGARLFTGPLHQKYNAVLRGLTAGEGSKLHAHFGELCAGNTYATSIHALHSAIFKMSKIGTAQKVYRGVSATVLPDWLWRPGADTAPALGGVEFGFLSATTEAELALRYAADLTTTSDGAKKVVLEMQTGLLTRGADVAWLSQYPLECESVFLPGTGHELTGKRVDGTVVVVGLRLSTKGSTETLHQIITKLKRSHLQLIEHYLEDMRVCEVPEKALGRLRALASTHSRYEQAHYNNPEKFRESTAAAVAAQRHVITKLAQPSTWDEVGGDGAEKARKMEKAAAYCRRVGRGDVASALHRLASNLAAGKGGWRPWRPGGSLPAGPDLKGLA